MANGSLFSIDHLFFNIAAFANDPLVPCGMETKRLRETAKSKRSEKMEQEFMLAGKAGSWMADFCIDRDAMPEGRIVNITSGEKEVLEFFVSQEGAKASIHTCWESDTRHFGKNPEFTFTLMSPNAGRQIRLCWQGFSFRLYIDGELEDEDWPLGTPPEGEWKAVLQESVTEFALNDFEGIMADEEQLYERPFQNFVLPGHNTGVGDCMPFVRDGRFCLYYLFDRRRHASKRGLGAHQWAQISTDDFRTWTIHPMAVGITEQWEGSICTGSLIQKEGKTYAFYAVRMSDGSPAKLTWAVSEDGVHFEKSGEYFSLTAPYEPVSARDPEVFQDEKGMYHMLVTTSLVKEGEYGGCLAHLTSMDLRNWEQQEPFIVPGYCDQPECSDYFFWNGWYYLIFSNFGTARYRMSRQPFGPWTRPPVDELDSLEIRVPKTAGYHGRRFAVGFLDRLPRGYAGNAITHELFQREDGSLGVKPFEEILPEMRLVECISETMLEAGQGRKAVRLPEFAGSFRLKAHLEAVTEGMLMGICLRTTGLEHRIEMNPGAGLVSIVRPGESLQYGSGRDLLKGAAHLKNTDIDLMVDGDILDLAVGDGRMMTMRLNGHASEGVTVEFYSIAGTVRVSGIELYVFDQG